PCRNVVYIHRPLWASIHHFNISNIKGQPSPLQHTIITNAYRLTREISATNNTNNTQSSLFKDIYTPPLLAGSPTSLSGYRIYPPPVLRNELCPLDMSIVSIGVVAVKQIRDLFM